MNAPQVSECRYCGDTFTAKGIGNHERYCDENPHSGISPEQQEELGLSEREGTDTDTDTHQDVGSGDGTLPPREQLSGADKTTRSLTADGSTDQVETTCPLCDSADTISSHDARREYEQQEDTPAPAVVLAFQLSERYCEECYALWGDEFPEPIPLQEAVGAVGGEE